METNDENKARITFEQPEKKDTYEFSQQKGTPGHCYQAQVFKNGKAFLSIDPTENEGDATYIAGKICDFLNEPAGQEQDLWEKMLIRYDQARMLRRGLKEVAKELMQEYTLTRKP